MVEPILVIVEEPSTKLMLLKIDCFSCLIAFIPGTSCSIFTTIPVISKTFPKVKWLLYCLILNEMVLNRKNRIALVYLSSLRLLFMLSLWFVFT